MESSKNRSKKAEKDKIETKEKERKVEKEEGKQEGATRNRREKSKAKIFHSSSLPSPASGSVLVSMSEAQKKGDGDVPDPNPNLDHLDHLDHLDVDLDQDKHENAGRGKSSENYVQLERERERKADNGRKREEEEEENTFSSTCLTYIETTVQIETALPFPSTPTPTSMSTSISTSAPNSNSNSMLNQPEAEQAEQAERESEKLILPFKYQQQETSTSTSSRFPALGRNKQQTFDCSTTVDTDYTRGKTGAETAGLNEITLNSAGSYPQDASSSRCTKQAVNIFTLYKDDQVDARTPTKRLRNAFSLDSTLDERGRDQKDVQERLRLLISNFSKRTSVTKEKIRRPVTPTYDTSSDSLDDERSGPQLLNRLNEFFPTSNEGSTANIWTPADSHSEKGWKLKLTRVWKQFSHSIFNTAIDPQSKLYVCWLLVVSMCFLYNAWVIPLRQVFPYQSPHNTKNWMIVDMLCDLIYLIDILVVKSHIKFISNGFWVKDPTEIRNNYFHSHQFKMSFITLFPLDIIFSLFFNNKPWLRLPRLIKIGTFWELFRRVDAVLSSPYGIRIARSFLYMLYLIHMYACAYYALSTWERNAGYQTDWIFDGHGNAYIRCFYFATKTATSIGKNPKPENEIEYLFMTCAWLSGVFVFAVLIGQIRDIIATATKSQTEYRQLLYSTVNYLHRLEVPKELQERVKLWITYTWEQQKTLDEKSVLSLLPHKMQTDLALHVHIEMLNKVKLFQHCEVAFLRDLVLRLRSVIFLPGDFVCRKGEMGKEMYIVKTGRVDVIGGEPGTEKILASLNAGSVFGEIALLQVGGMDKRTADVQSVGFSNLFLLTKKDIQEVIKDYPLAQDSLRKQAKKLMKQNQAKVKEAEKLFKAKSKSKTKAKSKSKSKSKADAIAKGKEEKFVGAAKKLSSSSENESESESVDVIIKGERRRKRQPKLIDTVLKVLPPTSKTVQYLQYGFKAVEPPSPQGSLMSISSYPQSPFLPVNMHYDFINDDIQLSSSSSENFLSVTNEDGNDIGVFNPNEKDERSDSENPETPSSRGQLTRQSRIEDDSKDEHEFP